MSSVETVACHSVNHAMPRQALVGEDLAEAFRAHSLPDDRGDRPHEEDDEEREREREERHACRDAGQPSTVEVHSLIHSSRFFAISSGGSDNGLSGTTEYFTNSSGSTAFVFTGYTNMLSGMSF